MLFEKYLKSCLTVSKMVSRIRNEGVYGLNLVYLTLNYVKKSVISTFVQNYGAPILNIKTIIKDKSLCFYSDTKYYIYFSIFNY